MRLKALTLIGNLFVKERLNYFVTAASSAAKNRTIRLKTYTVNTSSYLFLIIFSISLSDKVFYFATNHIRLEIYLHPSYPLPFFLSYGLKITEKEASDK